MSETGLDQQLKDDVIEHFAHIRLPEGLRSSADKPNYFDFLKPYEQALLYDANLMSKNEEHLLNKQRSGLFGNGPIQFMQWQVEADPSTVWGIQMKIDTQKDQNLKIPREVWLARMIRPYATNLRNYWIGTNAFAFRHLEGASYDTTILRREILTRFKIELNEQGLITYVAFRTRDERGTAIFQTIKLRRQEREGLVDPKPTPMMRTLLQIPLRLLPLEKENSQEEI